MVIYAFPVLSNYLTLAGIELWPSPLPPYKIKILMVYLVLNRNLLCGMYAPYH